MHNMQMNKKLEPALLEILSQKKVRNQNTLAKLLADRGMKTDQSTLSRYLAKLGIEKKDGFYHLNQTKKEGVQIVPVPPNLIVLKTLPGHAQALAFKLDNLPMPGLVGTIAGDDTVLCIVEGPKMIKSVCNRLYGMD
jgi:transcriptional regulator of arginine metabolism